MMLYEIATYIDDELRGYYHIDVPTPKEAYDQAMREIGNCFRRYDKYDDSFEIYFRENRIEIWRVTKDRDWQIAEIVISEPAEVPPLDDGFLIIVLFNKTPILHDSWSDLIDAVSNNIITSSVGMSRAFRSAVIDFINTGGTGKNYWRDGEDVIHSHNKWLVVKRHKDTVRIRTAAIYDK